MRFTILGSSGFVGSHLLAHLRQQGHECFAPGKNDPSVFRRELGQVIYCIGVTADFRQRPFDAARAHVCVLADVLEKARYESLLYLSSTRVYGKAQSTEEDTVFQVDSRDPSQLYNLTKLTGESLCFATGRAAVRVARLSNVFGADFKSGNFLPSLIRNAVMHGRIELHTTPDSAKDYVGIDDVAGILPRIAVSGRHRIYNVASGRNTTTRELLDGIVRATGARVEVAPDAVTTVFPPMEIGRVADEFGFQSADLVMRLMTLVEECRCAARQDADGV